MSLFARWSPLWLALLLPACSSSDAETAKGPPPQEAAPVVVSALVERDFADSLEALGTARADESVQVTSRVSGRVRVVHFTEGSAVRMGEPLVTLEDDEERAELSAARASAEQAQSRYQRMEELSGKGLVSQDALGEQADVLKSARARLELAQVRLEQRTIVAPFPGVLGFRLVSPGTLVTPGLGIVALDKIDSIRVDFAVPEAQLRQLAAGNAVSATSVAWTGETFEGLVTVVASRVDAATRAISAQARIVNADRKLKPGMLLTLRIDGPARKVFFVPESALIPENDSQFVWRLKPDQQAEKVRVDIGVREPGWVEITKGLQADDRVVSEGGMHLRPGRSVRIVEAPKG